jgi:HK97 family phage portal protein
MSIVRQLFGLPDRRTAADVDDWKTIDYPWSEIMGRSVAKTGNLITAQSMATIPAVYCAARRISENVARCRPMIYRMNDRGGKEEAKDHYLYSLLKWQPDPEQGIRGFLDTSSFAGAFRGNSYAFKDWSTRGKLRSWYYLHPDRVSLTRTAGKLKYYVARDYTVSGDPLGIGGEYDPEEIMHFKLTSYDGIMGLSPLQVHADTFGLAIGARNYMSGLLKNAATPRGIITTEPGVNLTEEQLEKRKTMWQSTNAGGANAGRTAFLPGGFKYQPVMLTPADIQIIENYRLTKSDIAIIFMVPLHMLGENEHATQNNVEQQSLEFRQFTILPWVDNWKETFNLHLLHDFEREDGLFIDFDTDLLLTGDVAALTAAAATRVRSGITNINEERAKIGYNPVEGGDKNKTQMQMVDITANPAEMGVKGAQKPAQNDQNQNENDQNRAITALKGVVLDVSERVCAKTCAVLRNLVKKHENLKEFERAAEKEFVELEKFTRAMLTPVSLRLAEAMLDEQFSIATLDDLMGLRANLFVHRVRYLLGSAGADIAERVAACDEKEMARILAGEVLRDVEVLQEAKKDVA